MSTTTELNANTTLRASVQVRTLEDLVALNQAELDSLYAKSPAGPMPDGPSRGKALFFPGTGATGVMAAIAKVFWQGKVFHAKDGYLLNRVVGFNTIKAKVFEGESWMDGKPSIIIDYQGTSLTVPFIRDEIRLIGDKLYLGRAYSRTPSGGRAMVINFALDFK